MNKKFLLILPLVASIFAGCSNEENIAVESMSLNETTLSLEVGDTFTLVPQFTPYNATNKEVTWSSSDPEVASVNNGYVVALKDGDTQISVTTLDQNKTATCSVSVYSQNPIIHVQDVSLNETEYTAKIGEEVDLIAIILPSNATNKNVTWESSNPIVASVNNGKVSAIAEGETTITVKTVDGNRTATCEFIVVNENEPIDPPEDDVETATFDYDVASQGKSNISSITNTITIEHFNFDFAKNDGNNAPGYFYTSTGKVGTFRLYPKNSTTISSEKRMVSISFEYFDDKDNSSLEFTSNDSLFNGVTWTGKSNSITFTVGDGTSGCRAIKHITIEYETTLVNHENIDLGVKTIKEVKDYIENNPFELNKANCAVNEYVRVTIKGFALAKISLIKTAKEYGLDVSEPSKIIMGDSTDAIAVATKVGEGTFYNKVSKYQMKDTSRYTVSGYISVYLGHPEILCDSFSWDENLDVTLDINAISKENISLVEFYQKAQDNEYNCAGHGYGEVYTIQGLTCYYAEADGQGKDYYNLTDGTNNIRVNAYNIPGISVGNCYDVTGILSIKSYSPIIIAFKITKSSKTPANLNDFYETAANDLSINDLMKVKGTQSDSLDRFDNLVNAYSKIYKATAYMNIVEEGNLYVGVSESYLGEYFLSGKVNTMRDKSVALIKNNNFWNVNEDELARFNPYYEEYMCENKPVEIYYIVRQLGYSSNKPCWEILLVPQSIPAIS